MTRQPPKIATWLLKHFGSVANIDAVLGDVIERYRQDQSSAWYWYQTGTIVFAGVMTRILASGRIAMKHKSAWALAMVSVFLIGFWVGRIPSKHTIGVAAIKNDMPEVEKMANVQKPNQNAENQGELSPQPVKHETYQKGKMPKEVLEKQILRVSGTRDFFEMEVKKAQEINDRDNTPESRKFLASMSEKLDSIRRYDATVGQSQ